MKKLLLLSLLLQIGAHVQGQNNHQDDIEGVKNACYDYIDTFYKVDTTLAYRSVHPSLQKRGFYFNPKDNAYTKQLEMPFPALIRLAKLWNKNGNEANEKSPREVVVFEVSDKTATAKVTAAWGIDYMHLIKENGKWYIVNVLWQSPPKFMVSTK
jgi:Putative lumazine-binding